MKTNLKQVLNILCSNFKLEKALLLCHNPELESVLNYYRVPYIVATRDLEDNFCENDAADFSEFMADFDLAVVDTFGSYIFKYRLLNYLSDMRVKFLINDTKAVDFKDSSYNVSRFRHNGRDFKLHYLDAIEEAFRAQDLANKDYK